MKIQNYINGQLIDPVAGQHLDNINPATGKVYGIIPDSDAQDVESGGYSGKSCFSGME
jgi:aminomuconate-semialdehyde/2-hydroxymuconate-6-semialdehyde dehydrogenase